MLQWLFGFSSLWSFRKVASAVVLGVQFFSGGEGASPALNCLHLALGRLWFSQFFCFLGVWLELAWLEKAGGQGWAQSLIPKSKPSAKPPKSCKMPTKRCDQHLKIYQNHKKSKPSKPNQPKVTQATSLKCHRSQKPTPQKPQTAKATEVTRREIEIKQHNSIIV